MAAADPLIAFQSMVQSVGDFPTEAFLFVRDGLHAAASALRGEETETHQAVHQYLQQNGLDWGQLSARFEARELPDDLMEMIIRAGGCAKLNRHVTGRELCWALRDLAVERWGMLARTVLYSWGVRTTHDFGRMVFAYIEHGLMQQQPSDSVKDFDEVFDFEEAFPQDMVAD